ncbi:23S rRNA (uracil-5-)-methyltransferase RumB [Beutenbergia cavernae DSM 12333]|uniref:23S rRNA (Uracil-5-)-methyltransferase RumB n=1 Tax=Beutenbergia cavernae (strain ATCC BAA-8 / DSM 12333 / CCUG 43141 / JCM 11478 / NBRC 16432 / NCIMB 13614 / HKI 0122) TaxID=471853 RepID=C5C2M0_BEUC1|nr:23S rRNA (uracil(747)-C(5))-methyltransferase RlmC [Beutenbergia cavernae]ACQ79706.1 23S rRNA (uracil-5-)-methyltransferase RumB [Beutenbergia cavernae DSM 12333]
MQCSYYDAALCRSCTLIERPYADQLAGKQAHARAALTGHDGVAWLPPHPSAEEQFRNKAKMVVTGSAVDPVIGILGPDGEGVDLRWCGLHEPPVTAALSPLAEFVARANLAPYDLRTRRGELKYLLVTASPDGEVMVRFVLRSTEALARIRKHLPALQEALPRLAVASVNVQPEHSAVLEGPTEIPLTPAQTLRMAVNGLDLHLRPQSFFQTNTAVAAALYREATDWIDELAPSSVVDLYCGVGPFALHAAARDTERRVLGVETSAEAIASATHSAADAGLANARFAVGDATAFAADDDGVPDVVIVNPPRRGIGPDLAAWLERSGVRHVVYSSCSSASLARDLAVMPSLRPVRARVLDMFPQTAHYEVLTLLERG